MQKIVNPNLPLTFLEQRLNHARQNPGRTWIPYVENVPVWPKHLVPAYEPTSDAAMYYQSCQGDPQLREALCEREARVNNISITPDQVLITNGALHGLSLTVRLMAEPGATALCQSPPYTCVDKLLRNAGFKIEYFKAPSNDGPLSPELISALKRSRVVYINSPHNPTGGVLGEVFMKNLGELCSEFGIGLISDQVYDNFALGDSAIPAALAHSPTWVKAIAVNSFSKNFGMPGLRVGWIVSSPQNISALTGLLEMDCVAVCGSAQDHARQVLKHGNESLVSEVRKRHQSMAKILKEIPGISYAEPEGGLQYLVQLPVADVEDFADYLMLTHGVIVATTANFANLEGSYIRLSFSYEVSVSEKALALLKIALKEYKNR